MQQLATHPIVDLQLARARQYQQIPAIGRYFLLDRPRHRQHFERPGLLPEVQTIERRQRAFGVGPDHPFTRLLESCGALFGGIRNARQFAVGFGTAGADHHRVVPATVQKPAGRLVQMHAMSRQAVFDTPDLFAAGTIENLHHARAQMPDVEKPLGFEVVVVIGVGELIDRGLRGSQCLVTGVVHHQDPRAALHEYRIAAADRRHSATANASRRVGENRAHDHRRLRLRHRRVDTGIDYRDEIPVRIPTAHRKQVARVATDTELHHIGWRSNAGHDLARRQVYRDYLAGLRVGGEQARLEVGGLRYPGNRAMR